MSNEPSVEWIREERLEDVCCGEGYLLYDSRWWRIAGSTTDSTGDEVVELDIAGPSDPLNFETSDLVAPGDSLVSYTDAMTRLQFRDGELLETLWPDRSIIYIQDARRRGIGEDQSEVVHGIFILRYGADGDAYYSHADSSEQPGARSHWLLFKGWDLILDWKPVDVSELLSWMESGNGSV